MGHFAFFFAHANYPHFELKISYDDDILHFFVIV